MYRYPIGRSGTAQDLMGIVTGAAERILARDRLVLPCKHPVARRVLEAPFNLCGILMRAILELVPADGTLAFHEMICRRLVGGQTYSFDDGSPALARAAAEARVLQASGRAPALMAVLSHPPALGEMAHLNFELVRHACRALRSVRGRACRPRFVVAVDPFGMDTASLPEEGFCAGFMGFYHLGVDRLAFTRSSQSSFLVARSAWPNLIWRLLRRLCSGGEVAMVLSGGVPTTARVLYMAREWLVCERRRAPLRHEPARVLRALRRSPGFVRFESEGPHGKGLRSNAWRMAEGWVMSAIAEHPEGRLSCAETGELTLPARETFAACLEALGVDRAGQGPALESLAEECKRETPFRRRFFRIMAGRVLRRGRPVILLPVVHRIAPRLGVEIREAWCWLGMKGAVLQARRLGDRPLDWQGTVDDFAVEFGRENYA